MSDMFIHVFLRIDSRITYKLICYNNVHWTGNIPRTGSGLSYAKTSDTPLCDICRLDAFVKHSPEAFTDFSESNSDGANLMMKSCLCIIDSENYLLHKMFETIKDLFLLQAETEWYVAVPATANWFYS